MALPFVIDPGVALAGEKGGGSHFGRTGGGVMPTYTKQKPSGGNGNVAGKWNIKQNSAAKKARKPSISDIHVMKHPDKASTDLFH
jgi:hypothetical protein